MTLICKDCKDDLPQNAHIGGLHTCTKCKENFGFKYCLDCLIWYFDIKRRLCKLCERGIQG
jgi:hypothetical protein